MRVKRLSPSPVSNIKVAKSDLKKQNRSDEEMSPRNSIASSPEPTSVLDRKTTFKPIICESDTDTDVDMMDAEGEREIDVEVDIQRQQLSLEIHLPKLEPQLQSQPPQPKPQQPSPSLSLTPSSSSSPQQQLTTEEKLLALRSSHASLAQQIERLIENHEMFVKAVRKGISDASRFNKQLEKMELQLLRSKKTTSDGIN